MGDRDEFGEETATLLDDVLDQLDVGVLVCDARLERVALANTAGAAVLAAFGGPAERLDLELKQAATAALAHATVRGAGRAMPASTSAGRRYFVRAKPMDGEDSVLVTVTLAALRAREVFALLQRRFGISLRQCEVVEHLRSGRTNQEIALDIGLATASVKKIVGGILDAMGVRNRTELVALIDELSRGR